jgi:hypothetical protein
MASPGDLKMEFGVAGLLAELRGRHAHPRFME